MEASNELDRLQSISWEAKKNVADLKNIRSMEYSSRCLVVAEQLKAEGFDQRIDDAVLLAQSAGAEVTAEKERLALTGVGCAVPIGTKVVKWEGPSWSSYSRDQSMKPVATGVVEAVTMESAFSGRQFSPSVGSFVVRINKKNGKPGLKCERITWNLNDSGLPYGWHIEGVDPNKGEAEVKAK